MNMDTPPETTETRETKPVEQTEKLSPAGISAMQGQDALVQPEQIEPPPTPNDTPPPPEDTSPQAQSETAPPPSVPQGADHPPYKPGYQGETSPFVEGQPLDEKSNREGPILPPEEPVNEKPTEDVEGKKPPKPPEGWRPGGIEGGG